MITTRNIRIVSKIMLNRQQYTTAEIKWNYGVLHFAELGYTL